MESTAGWTGPLGTTCLPANPWSPLSSSLSQILISWPQHDPRVAMETLDHWPRRTLDSPIIKASATSHSDSLVTKATATSVSELGVELHTHNPNPSTCEAELGRSPVLHSGFTASLNYVI